MPTVGWIMDSVLDRQIDALQRAGSIGASRAPRLTPPRLPCPYCDATFADDAARVEHIGFAHLVDVPLFTVAGTPLPRETTFRRSLASDEVRLANATHVELLLDGRMVHTGDPADLPGLLAGRSRGRCDVRLSNARADAATATVTHVLRFDVPDPAELEDIDLRFEETLARDDVTMEHVVDFARATDRLRSATAYADAYAGYVTGVLIKDGDFSRGATRPFEEYHAKFNRALSVLRDFDDRPLAHLVASCIRLNFNDLNAGAAPTGAPALDDVMIALAEVTGAGPVARLESDATVKPTRAGCPIDRWTAELMNRWAQCLTGPGPDAGRALAARATAAGLAPLDAAKYRVLAALALRRAEAETGSLLRDLQHDPVFGRWATAAIGGGRERTG